MQIRKLSNFEISVLIESQLDIAAILLCKQKCGTKNKEWGKNKFFHCLCVVELCCKYTAMYCFFQIFHS